MSQSRPVKNLVSVRVYSTYDNNFRPYATYEKQIDETEKGLLFDIITQTGYQAYVPPNRIVHTTRNVTGRKKLLRSRQDVLSAKNEIHDIELLNILDAIPFPLESIKWRLRVNDIEKPLIYRSAEEMFARVLEYARFCVECKKTYVQLRISALERLPWKEYIKKSLTPASCPIKKYVVSFIAYSSYEKMTKESEKDLGFEVINVTGYRSYDPLNPRALEGRTTSRVTSRIKFTCPRQELLNPSAVLRDFDFIDEIMDDIPVPCELNEYRLYIPGLEAPIVCDRLNEIIDLLLEEAYRCVKYERKCLYLRTTVLKRLPLEEYYNKIQSADSGVSGFDSAVAAAQVHV